MRAKTQNNPVRGRDKKVAVAKSARSKLCCWHKVGLELRGNVCWYIKCEVETAGPWCIRGGGVSDTCNHTIYVFCVPHILLSILFYLCSIQYSILYSILYSIVFYCTFYFLFFILFFILFCVLFFVFFFSF